MPSPYLVRAIKQSSVPGDAARVLHKKENGYLYNIDGRVFYSPNAKRSSLKVPFGDPDVGANVIMGRDYNLRAFLQPHWWSKPNAFLAFVPLFPDGDTLPRNPLDSFPLVTWNKYRRRAVYSQYTWDQWRRYQHNLSTACHLLLYDSGAAAVRPALPCARVDTNPDNRSKDDLVQQIVEAREWFDIWHGVLSYAIAVSRAIEVASGSMRSERGPPKWMETLLAPREEYLRKVEATNLQREAYRNRPELWLPEESETFGALPPSDEVLDEWFASSLLNSCLGSFDGSVDRVGTFVRIPSSQNDEMVSIDWLCDFNVPVFYEWGAREEKLAKENEFWRRYAPPPNAEWVTLPIDTSLPSVPSLVPEPAITKQKYYAIQDIPPPDERSWIDYFKSMEENAPREWAQLSDKERTKRRAWEKNPPRDPRKTKYVVWAWEKASKRCIIRAATEDDLEDLNNGLYSATQRRYFAVRNVWHLCRYMGGPDEAYLHSLVEEEMDNSDPEYDRKYEEAMLKWRIYFRLDPPPPEVPAHDPDSPSHFPGPEVSDIPMEQGDMAASDGSSANSSESEIALAERRELAKVVTWMSEALGFTFPPDLIRDAKSSNIAGVKGLAKYIFTLRTSSYIDDQYWTTVEGQAIFRFVRGLVKEPIVTDLCDLAKGNHRAISSLARYKILRRRVQEVSVQLSEWHNIEGYIFSLKKQLASCYWLDLPSADGWYVGSQHAASVLLMARLEVPTDPYEIAIDMAYRGAQFQTWHEAHDIDEASITLAQSPQLLIYRWSLTSPFYQKDYDQYLHQAHLLLNKESCARAAIRRGGIIWRLAVEYGVQPASVISGPPTPRARTGHGTLRYIQNGCYFVDDALNSDEECAITGVYIAAIQESEQRGRLCWWPPADMWDEHFGTLGWSDSQEEFFQTHMDYILNTFTPWTYADCRRELRIGEKKAAKFWRSVEEASKSCL
ncbi:hypothetical protein DFP72DRAFT_1065094 [Ephemerocybe angulata]|uniref:Uncharacterized protein n=1 Tax=Ephemerocybe angulata TaxID=980116 RepID=A0A8H6MA16_9AGAR|nr:hypothetical protein DFP72DRAFT_1065094 [Tulosesus angulatus]